MILDISITIAFIAITAFLCKKAISNKKHISEKLKTLEKHFELSEKKHENIFQIITAHQGNPNFLYLISVATLQKTFCLFHNIFMGTGKETLILKGEIKNKSMNCYVFRKNLKLKHVGIDYCDKVITGSSEYVYKGTYFSFIFDFVNRYKLSSFYISYLPKELIDEPTFETEFCIQGCISVLEQESFVDDFINLFEKINEQEESKGAIKKVEDTKKLYLNALSKKQMKENEKKVEEERKENKNKKKEKKQKFKKLTIKK